MSIIAKKTIRDLKVYLRQYTVIAVAVAITLTALATFLTTYAVMKREITRNYLGTLPAHVTFEMVNPDDRLAGIAASMSGVEAAEMRGKLSLRMKGAGEEWFPLTAYVVPDFDSMQLAVFRPESGSWPPGPGEILLERMVPDVIGLTHGDSFETVSDAGAGGLTIGGTVHDPSLAPAGQERRAVGYITPRTMKLLDRDMNLDDLKVRFAGVSSRDEIIEMAQQMSDFLMKRDYIVAEAMIPPFQRHPHQSQMEIILSLFLVFSLLCLVLSAVLAANLIWGIMSREVRQIAIMKTIGAGPFQTAVPYIQSILIVSFLAAAISLPMGYLAGNKMAGMLSDMLNLTVYSQSLPIQVPLIVLSAGILIPVLFAGIPVLLANFRTIRESLRGSEIKSAASGRAGIDLKLPPVLKMALKNMFRRPGRLVLSLTLLSIAGGLFMTARNVESAWNSFLFRSFENQAYDLEIRMFGSVGEEKGLELLASIDQIKEAEGWNVFSGAEYREEEVFITSTYPDGGHGAFLVRGVPGDTNMIEPGLLEGNWLDAGSSGGVVLNQGAFARFGRPAIGDPVRIEAGGSIREYTLTGVIQEIGQDAAYVNKVSDGRVQSFFINFTGGYAGENTVQEIESLFTDNGLPIKMVIRADEFENVVTEHIAIIIYSLILLGLVMAVVGALGLASSIGTAVLERSREIGVLRTIGAADGRIFLLILLEGLFTGIMSLLPAFGIAAVFSLIMGNSLGVIAFQSPLGLTFSAAGNLWWTLLLITGVFVSVYFPARRAVRLTIKDTLLWE